MKDIDAEFQTSYCSLESIENSSIENVLSNS